MLVDEPHRFRERVATRLVDADVDVLQASDVYEALRLVRGSEIDLLVIGGDQRYQSGWRCAGKLCGRPPWRGVILYFDHVSDRDRLWGQVSQLSALIETKGRTEPLVRAVLRALRQSLPAGERHLHGDGAAIAKGGLSMNKLADFDQRSARSIPH